MSRFCAVPLLGLLSIVVVDNDNCQHGIGREKIFSPNVGSAFMSFLYIAVEILFLSFYVANVLFQFVPETSFWLL